MRGAYVKPESDAPRSPHSEICHAANAIHSELQRGTVLCKEDIEGYLDITSANFQPVINRLVLQGKLRKILTIADGNIIEQYQIL